MNDVPREFHLLYSSFQIGSMKLKNRMVFQPHVPYFASRDGYPTEVTKNYYIERAKGGIGLIVMESMMVHPSGVYAPGCICLFNENVVESFGDFTEQVHRYGAKIIGQLSHCGGDTVAKPFQLACAPSQIPDFGSRVIPKELEPETIQEIIEGFGEGAQRLEEAGFDGAELKFAHDGLLRAFALPALNQRTDSYGQTYENRLRFFHEIVLSIRRHTSKSFVLGVRLCLDQFVDEGIDQNLGVRLAQSCEEFGIDYINGDSGGASDGSMQIFPMCMPLGAGVYLASHVRKKVNIPVIGFGRLNDPVLMETVLEEGHADLVGSARQFICDPETPNKAREGRLNDIRHCIACNEACIFQCMNAKPIRCVQNPACGREKEFGIGSIRRAEKAKKIMVIGAGIAGMKVAEISAKENHEVVVYEKEKQAGGQINLAEKLPYRAEISEVSRYLKLQLDKYKVPIHFNTEADMELIDREQPDIVVFATGSAEWIPEIAGAEHTEIKIMNVREVLTRPEMVGKRVAVLDRNGHVKGAEIAEYILGLGSEVFYFTPFEQMGPDMDSLTLELLRRRIYEHDSFCCNTFYDLDYVCGNRVSFKHKYSRQSIEIDHVDTLVIADHARSVDALYKKTKKRRNHVYAVGDCNAPRLIEQNILESEMLARQFV